MSSKSNVNGTIEEARHRGLKFTASLTGMFPKSTSPVDAIRRKCLDCTAGQVAEISDCQIKTCALWPYRMGKNPFHARAKNKAEG